jgi:hypothetical protein
MPKFLLMKINAKNILKTGQYLAFISHKLLIYSILYKQGTVNSKLKFIF